MKLPPRRKLKLFLLAWMLVLFSALIVLATLILVQHNNTELTEVKSELSPLNVVLHAEEDTVQIQGKPITEQAWFIPTVAGCFGFSALAIILGLAIGLPIVKRKEKRLLEEKERQEQLAEQLQRISAQQEEQQALEQQAAAEAHAEAEVEPAHNQYQYHLNPKSKLTSVPVLVSHLNPVWRLVQVCRHTPVWLQDLVSHLNPVWRLVQVCRHTPVWLQDLVSHLNPVWRLVQACRHTPVWLQDLVSHLNPVWRLVPECNHHVLACHPNPVFHQNAN
uniref:Mutant adhesin-related protein P30 n=1 Tax=Mycoplasmoides pneumoniae TaxID=2104 RepID=Q9XDC1_MYCPM|nr:mutant adhesin-related protein P30 [Mycoplasmoides pneumoniae]